MNKNNLLEGAYYTKEPSFAQIDEIFNYFNEDGQIVTDNLSKLQIEYLNKLKEEFRSNYIEHNSNTNINVKENWC